MYKFKVTFQSFLVVYYDNLNKYIALNTQNLHRKSFEHERVRKDISSYAIILSNQSSIQETRAGIDSYSPCYLCCKIIMQNNVYSLLTCRNRSRIRKRL